MKRKILIVRDRFSIFNRLLSPPTETFIQHSVLKYQIHIAYLANRYRLVETPTGSAKQHPTASLFLETGETFNFYMFTFR